MPLAACARITGRYSGLAPAITALTATFSTVSSQNSRNAVGRSRPTTLSGGWLVPLSIAATRSSVGRMTGRKSVQLFSRNSRWRLSSVSGASSRGVERSNDRPLRSSSSSGLRQPLDHLLHERPARDRIAALDVAAQLLGRVVDDRLRHVDLARARHAVGTRRPIARAARTRGCARRPTERRPAPAPSRAPRPWGYRCFKDRHPGWRRRRRPRSSRACPGRRPSSRAA